MSTKLGHFQTIQNTEKPVFSHAKDTYIAGWVCDHEGNNEQYLMFADTELTKSCELKLQLTDIKLGRMYSMIQSGKHSFILSCVVDGTPKVVKIPACRVKRAIKRTANNPEDVKARTFWDKLFS